MVKNIIFDMGNVLIKWDPAGLIARQGVTGEDAKRLLREVFFLQRRKPIFEPAAQSLLLSLHSLSEEAAAGI